jgi:hypothetical protein
MAFDGYFVLGGNEIINSARAVTYSAQADGLLTDCTDCPDLALGIQGQRYTTPLVDDAPWLDPDNPDTYNFWGVYPLEITGLEDSVRSAVVTEGLNDGGVIGPLRQATRTIVFKVLLMGADECAVMAGMSWLRWACLGNTCGQAGVGCSGDDLCFLSCCPPMCEDDPNFPDCLGDFARTMRMVSVTEGPSVDTKHALSDGSQAWEVQFTAVAGVPWTYGPESQVFQWHAPTTPVPLPVVVGLVDDVCADPDFVDLVKDPWCPYPTPPPLLPVLDTDCVDIPATWDRYAVPIPATAIRTWQDSVPIIKLTTASAASDYAHNVRLRFYTDPLGRADVTALDECAFCGEFYVTYIPQASTMVIDGSDETITVLQGVSTVLNAQRNVMGTDGGPFSWPLLACGHAYVMTLDMESGDPPPNQIEVSMVTRGI